MPIFICGISHKTASLPLREKLACSTQQIAALLSIACANASLMEVVLLSTCNRSEIIYLADEGDYAFEWWCKIHQLTSEDKNAVYHYQDAEAVCHLMRVGCGIDSMVLGEPQILGQLKDAYKVAKEAGTVGGQLDLLFQYTFAACKRIRTQTTIGQEPVSCASVAINLAKYIFSDFQHLQVMLVGSGDMTLLAAQHFREQGVQRLKTISRTTEQANLIAEKLQAEAATLDELPAILPQTDIVLTATASPYPLFTLDLIETAIYTRAARPLLLIDLALPRDIDPGVASLDGVYLYNIDDLQHIQQEGLNKRTLAAKQAEKMIQIEVSYFMAKIQEQAFTQIIQAYRHNVEKLREAELEKARALLSAGHPPDDVLQAMARSLTNKLMHPPSVELRRASRHGHQDVLDIARRLLGLHADKKIMMKEGYETEY